MRLCTQFGSRAKLSRAGDTTKQVGITAFWSAVRGGLKPPPRGRVGGGPGWLGTHWREGGGVGAARVRPDRAEVLSKRGAAQRCPWALHSPQAFLGWVLSPAGTSEGGGQFSPGPLGDNFRTFCSGVSDFGEEGGTDTSPGASLVFPHCVPNRKLTKNPAFWADELGSGPGSH